MCQLCAGGWEYKSRKRHCGPCFEDYNLWGAQVTAMAKEGCGCTGPRSRGHMRTSPEGRSLEERSGLMEWEGNKPPKHEGRGGVPNSPKVSLGGYKARKTVWHSNETLDASLPLYHRQEDRETHKVWLLLG